MTQANLPDSNGDVEMKRAREGDSEEVSQAAAQAIGGPAGQAVMGDA